jgi:hypothetical protein
MCLQSIAPPAFALDFESEEEAGFVLPLSPCAWFRLLKASAIFSLNPLKIRKTNSFFLCEPTIKAQNFHELNTVSKIS